MVEAEPVRRGEVYLVNLNPRRGDEIRTVRPCVVVTPDELNAHVRTFSVAPLTTGSHPYAFRVACRFGGKDGRSAAGSLLSGRRIHVVAPLGGATPRTRVTAHALR